MWEILCRLTFCFERVPALGAIAHPAMATGDVVKEDGLLCNAG